jgi:hypothetical protein
MTIKVTFDSFSKDKFNEVLDYYNSNKSQNDKPLEKLDRCEGGFMIEKEYSSSFSDANDSIKQLRWSRKCLVPYKNYSSFSIDEEQLLYRSLVEVFGEKEVILLE